MDARVAGGRAALLVTALFACEISPPSRPPAAVATLPAPPPPEASEAPVEAAEHAAEPPPRVVFMTIDGVRWEDVFAASGSLTMPSLDRLVADRGVALGGPGCDNDVRASGPNFVSLPGYLEMFTGKATRCTHNGCGPVQSETVIDEARHAAKGSGDVAVFSSWSKYANAVVHDRGAIVLSAGAGPLPRVASAAKAWPGHGDYRPDASTTRLALAYLETNAPHVLVVGLGDTDEHAHHGNVAGYREALRRADDFIGELDRTLARMGEADRTTVFVTTDHGRAHSLRAHGAAFPESQRVWVAAFGAGVAHRGISCAATPLRLSHLAGAVRERLDLGRDGEAGPLAAEILFHRATGAGAAL